MARYRIAAPDGKTYEIEGPEGATDEQVRAEVIRQHPHLSEPSKPEAPKVSSAPVRQGALTALQGATFNLADELAGGLAMRGASEAQRGAGMAGLKTQYAPAETMYEPARNYVRQQTAEFASAYPNTAAGLELAGGLSTLPFTMGAAPLRTGGVMMRGMRMAAPIATQSAISAAGKSEAPTFGELAGDVAEGTLTGLATGGAGVLAAKGLGGAARQIAERAGPLKEKLQINTARERLARLLERDAEAKMRMGAEPADVAAARLRSLGENAPLAATGKSTTAELGLLRNLPGSAEELTAREGRRIASQRGPALVAGAEEALSAQGSPFRESVDALVRQKQKDAAPFYRQLQGSTFVADKELVNLLERAKDAHGGAEKLARVSGISLTDLSKIKAGQPIPFETLDTVKKTLWDLKESAKGEFGKSTNLSRAYDDLRRKLIDKLDKLSPKDETGASIYKQARSAFETPAQMETAMRRGRDALKEDVTDLPGMIRDMEPAELEAFRIGAAQAVRDVAKTQSGQTKLLNLYKEPTLKEKLQAIFGNDFRTFQKSVLQQEQLKAVERAGQGSQTAKLLAGSEDQGAFMEGIEAARAAASGGFAPMEYIGRKFSQLKMPEQTRNQLAKMLLLRGEPAQQELRDVAAYMARRRRQQQAAGQLAGRVGAFGAQE